MKSMTKLAFALCLLALPATAWADGDYRFELTPQVSYHFGGTFDANSSSPAATDSLKLDNGVVYGLTFDIPLSNNLQVELLANTQKSDLFTDGGIFGPDIKRISADVSYAHIGLLVQFGRPAVTPYFVTSLGVTRIDPNFPGAGADDQFSASFGAGVKVFFTPFIGMRFEGRAFWTDVGGGKQSCNNYGCIQYRDYLSQGMATAGFIFAW
jgi:hypothetical protein